MNQSFFSASLALLLLASQASAEIVLTPKLVTLDFGGVPVRRAYFADGNKKFAVPIDKETELAPHGDGAIFRFTKIPLATVEFHRSPFKPGSGFDETNIAHYAKAARQFLAPNAEVWPEEPVVTDPLPINRWKTCRFNFFYHVGGSPVRVDVTFIDLNDKDQIVVVTGGSANNYEAVRSRSDHLMRRWHEVTPVIEAGVN